MWALVACLAMVLAGCASEEIEGPAAAPPEDDVQLDTRVSSTLGAVQGLVVDESHLPVGNATVTLSSGKRGGEELTRTNASAGGAFSFALLEPATYRVSAEATGFGTASGLVKVTAAEVAEVQLTLTEVASEEPYVIQLIQVGRLSCAGSYIVTPTGGNCPGEPREWNIVFEVPDGFVRVMSEAQWESPETLAQYFYVDNESTNSGATTLTLAELWGESPLRITFDPGEQKQTASENPVFAGTFTELPSEKFNLNTSTYNAGLYANEVNSTLGPACKYVYGRCAGVGFALDLRWTQYVSVFVNGLPADAESYTALPKE